MNVSANVGTAVVTEEGGSDTSFIEILDGE